MAIQFSCPGCNQPIEVDDVHAGKAATCPYCRNVVTVPEESTLGEPPIPARPTGGQEGDSIRAAEAGQYESDVGAYGYAGGGGLHVGPRLGPVEQAALKKGNIALWATALAVCILGFCTIFSAVKAMPAATGWAESQPNREVMTEQMEAFAREYPWLQYMQLAGMALAVLGLSLGITSLSQSRRNNWRAIISIVGCGGIVLCICGGTALFVFSSF